MEVCLNSTYTTYVTRFDWLEDMMRVLDKKAMADFMTILWNCWNSRNNYVFNGKKEEPKDIWSRASILSKDFRIHNRLKLPMLTTQIEVRKWVKAPKDCIKINFDASITNNRIGYGVIIRDEDGFVLGGDGGLKEGQLLTEEAEWHAFDESIKIAGRLNIKGDVIFESDCAGLVNKINGQNSDLSIIGERIKDIIKAFINFRSATCVWTSRQCNTVAYFICKKMCADACH
ncbi:hypothetical protein J1N35_016573 [Gossypium stocksii]|uniref:RNase H type-1 domain-containing protein n=1 Tax=Gossypium stocksii TaxID=47602 RepID=A0A9D3VKF9_9ROSI|nr:hypothetical protein J1N35_016573 [Gossypium stocksii]